MSNAHTIQPTTIHESVPYQGCLAGLFLVIVHVAGDTEWTPSAHLTLDQARSYVHKFVYDATEGEIDHCEWTVEDNSEHMWPNRRWTMVWNDDVQIEATIDEQF